MTPRDPGDWTPLIRARAKGRTFNPIDYVSGAALGRQLRHTTFPRQPSQNPITGPPIKIPNPRKRR